MGDNPPVVYILHGEDELSITQFIASLRSKLGDPALADLNTVRLDGRSVSFEDLETAANTPPFLTKRRLVILTHVLSRLATGSYQKRFKELLERVPPSIALVIVEYKPLTEKKEKNKSKLNWLEQWGHEAGERAYIRSFPQPEGIGLTRRIVELTKTAGGHISQPAAELLASLVGDNNRIANQEIQKLLAYVNYNRSIEPEDVEHLVANQSHGDIFGMVDAIGLRDGRKAIKLFHKQLEEQDAQSIFGMIIRQFRLVLLAREVLDQGGQETDVVQALRTPPFIAKKITGQARKFAMPLLEAIYCRLLEIDEGMKSGDIELSLALDSFIFEITR